MNLQPLPQEPLAAWIDAEGIDFEILVPVHGETEWESVSRSIKATSFINPPETYPIRIAPGALTDVYLPPGVPHHNPDNLTPEQITEGGKYRGVSPVEMDGRHGVNGSGVAEYYAYGKWHPHSFGDADGETNRVPLTTPFPKPAPASNEQSDTPRTDKWEYEQECNYDVPWEDHCRQLERESQDYLDTLTAIYDKLGISEGDAPGDEKVSDTVLRYINAARAREAEARALLERSRNSFQNIDSHEPDFASPELFYWNARNECRASLTAINTHLKL